MVSYASMYLWVKSSIQSFVGVSEHGIYLFANSPTANCLKESLFTNSGEKATNCHPCLQEYRCTTWTLSPPTLLCTCEAYSITCGRLHKQLQACNTPHPCLPVCLSLMQLNIHTCTSAFCLQRKNLSQQQERRALFFSWSHQWVGGQMEWWEF